MESVSEFLRGLPVFDRPLPDFDTTRVPAEPMALFLEWLREAVAAGVDEPHAMTLSTVDAEGAPDARVLILKNLDAEGFHFATESVSAKGRQVAARPVAALSFYWREQGRQVRVRGDVARAEPAVSARDFLARSDGSRAASLLGRQSDILRDRRDLEQAFEAAYARVTADPDLLADHHTVYVVRPRSVEFWQGNRARRHVRLRYRRTRQGWVTEELWP